LLDGKIVSIDEWIKTTDTTRLVKMLGYWKWKSLVWGDFRIILSWKKTNYKW
jgi:hypothetical protein